MMLPVSISFPGIFFLSRVTLPLLRRVSVAETCLQKWRGDTDYLLRKKRSFTYFLIAENVEEIPHVELLGWGRTKARSYETLAGKDSCRK